MASLNTVQQICDAFQYSLYMASGPQADDLSWQEALWGAQCIQNMCAQAGINKYNVIGELDNRAARGDINSNNWSMVRQYV